MASDEPPVAELAIHDRFPGAWQHWPADAKALLTEKLVERALEIHDGPGGMLKFLYAGTVRGGKRVGYMLPPTDYWRYLLEDLRERTDAEQPAKSLASAGTAV